MHTHTGNEVQLAETSAETRLTSASGRDATVGVFRKYI